MLICADFYDLNFTTSFITFDPAQLSLTASEGTERVDLPNMWDAGNMQSANSQHQTHPLVTQSNCRTSRVDFWHKMHQNGTILGFPNPLALEEAENLS